MSVEFTVTGRQRHSFRVTVGDDLVVEAKRSYATLGEARWAATRVLVELLDAQLPNVEHIVATRAGRSIDLSDDAGVRRTPPARIG